MDAPLQGRGEEPAMSERIRPMVFVLCVAWLVSATSLGAGSSVTVSAEDGGRLESCDEIRVRFDDEEGARSEEVLTLAGSTRRLRVSAPDQASVRIQSVEAEDIAVTVCRAAQAGRRRGAATLAAIDVTAAGDTLTVRGPAGNHWWAYLIVDAPPGTELDVRVGDGEIGLYEVSGQVEAATINGPLWARSFSGRLRARSKNGPIEIEGARGDIEVATENGPIEIALAGRQWDGERLRARTENGPVSLAVPEGYQSGIRLDASYHSPVDCRAPACRVAARTWDDDDERRLQLGTGSPAVHLSTVNGPVEIVSKN